MRLVLVAALLGGSLIGAGLSVPASADSSYGSMSAPPAVIQSGCHHYSYTYVIHPPADTNWDFIVQLNDPQNTPVGAQLWASGADGLSGTGSFELCSSQTPAGTYTLTGELDYSNGSQEAPTQVFLTPAHMVLTSPTATPVHHHRHHHRHQHRHHKRHAASIPTL